MKELFLSLSESYLPMSHERHHVCDTWGEAINLAFDIGSICMQRGISDGGLDYQSGAFGPEELEDKWREEQLIEMPTEKLEKLARYTNRVLDMLKHFEKDY
jgi:hypothetical protein